MQQIDIHMPIDPILHCRFRMPVSEGRALSLLHAFGRVLHSDLAGGEMLLEAEVPESLLRHLEPFVI